MTVGLARINSNKASTHHKLEVLNHLEHAQSIAWRIFRQLRSTFRELLFCMQSGNNWSDTELIKPRAILNTFKQKESNLSAARNVLEQKLQTLYFSRPKTDQLTVWLHSPKSVSSSSNEEEEDLAGEVMVELAADWQRNLFNPCCHRPSFAYARN